MPTAVSIRLSDDIAYELEGLARTIERSKTYIIRKAIESYLREYADYLVAIERLNDKDDEIISSDEMRNRLAL
ncbi:DNA-binding protein [Methanosarcinales archaeon]|nr:MAG: DNA-binding protein [Methanosarcinales archaeon]